MRKPALLTLFGLAFGLAVLSGGCGVGKREPTRANYFLIQPEFAPPEASLLAAPCVVIRPVTSQTTYRELPLLYRTSDVEFETDYYNRFMTSPPNQLTEALRRWADSLNWTICPDETIDFGTEHYILRPVLEAFYGDFRDRGNPGAVVEMQVTLSHVDPDCACANAVLSELYTARVGLESRSPDALVSALGRAVEEIMARLRADAAEAIR